MPIARPPESRKPRPTLRTTGPPARYGAAAGKWQLREVLLEVLPGVTVRKDLFRLSAAGAEVGIIKPFTPSGVRAGIRRARLMHEAGYTPRLIYYNPRSTRFLPTLKTLDPVNALWFAGCTPEERDRVVANLDYLAR
jgi:hypothetical protein